MAEKSGSVTGGKFVMDDKEQQIEVQQEENVDNCKEKPKPSISPNKDFYFVW